MTAQYAKHALLLVLFFTLLPLATTAQTTFTAHLRKHISGEGKVVVQQDAAIDDIVNNSRQKRYGKTTTGKASTPNPPTTPKTKRVVSSPNKPVKSQEAGEDQHQIQSDGKHQHEDARQAERHLGNQAEHKQESTERPHHTNIERREANEVPIPYIARQRYRAQGYRIQIFTGSNSHEDKMRAYAIGRKCQQRFPMLSIYPRFVNPRWICRVGDFRTHAEAQAFVNKIKAARITHEIRIVKSEVLLAR